MRTYKIQEISKIIFSGGTPSTQNRNFWDGDLPWLSSGETCNPYITMTNRRITKEGANNSSTRLALKGDIVIASAGQGLTRGQTSFLKINTYINQSIIAIRCNPSYVIDQYLFYNLYSRYDEMRLLSDSSSTRGSITTKMISDMNIILPSLEEQQHIVNTIGTIDDLIEFNNKIIDKLHAFSDLIYQNYLINTANTAFIMLGNCCEIKTGKLNAEASSINGKYPFFTCGKDELLIDDYAFDCKAIIVAGNGEISCKYYEGKFNAYQRTYVLSPTKYFNLFQKACELGINDLIINSQGSVIKFITKGMLEAISIPLNNETITTNQKLASLYDLMFKYKKKNNKLKQIKQNLLSKYF
ncbi:restriction endonuclease subunit S [Metamycoplasma equirhinis]|uniref:restriction endonuclease subunit S n=2 Tax=Metamycoplasma equirhinis TaxID=92402 RepID=UPI00359460CC